MKHHRAAILACLAAAAFPGTALANPQDDASNSGAANVEDAILNQRAQDIGRVFLGEITYEEVFTDVFVNAVSQSRFDGIVSRLTSELGPYAGVLEVIPAGESAAGVRFQFGAMVANTVMQISGDAPNKVASFIITGTWPMLDEGASISDKLAQLPGTTNLLFTKIDGEDQIRAHNAEVSLAVGSAFKLWVLSALVREIEAGNLAWDEVVTLGYPRAPFGAMERWPENSPVTLGTLATLMISGSDNTATDKLIEIVGRDKVEAELALTGHSDPSRNIPFLTTREFMLLKWQEDRGELDYGALDEAGRRGALAALVGKHISNQTATELFGGAPKHLDIE